MKKHFLFMLLIVLSINQIKAQCACCSGGATSGFSGGDSSPSSFVLGERKWMSEFYLENRSFNGISKSVNTENMGAHVSPLALTSMDIGIASIRYGLTNKMSIMVQQPLFLVNSSTINSKTTGDLLTLVNYFPLNNEDLKIGLQVGMEWPTGQVVAFNNGASISTGSGSYDPVAGINLLKPLKNSFIRMSGFFKYTTKGFNETYFGDFFGHQVNYTVFLKRNQANCSIDTLKNVKPLVSLNVQLSGEWSQSQVRDNVLLANTGSYVGIASVGTTISYKGFGMPITFSVPVYQNFVGQQNQTKYRFRIGITKTFN